MQLDPVRQKVVKLIAVKDTDLKHASLAIGKNPAYLHQFLYRGTPKVLPEDTREALAALLGVASDELRHSTPPGRRRPRAPNVNSALLPRGKQGFRSEEHTSELQSH